MRETAQRQKRLSLPQKRLTLRVLHDPHKRHQMLRLRKNRHREIHGCDGWVLPPRVLCLLRLQIQNNGEVLQEKQQAQMPEVLRERHPSLLGVQEASHQRKGVFGHGERVPSRVLQVREVPKENSRTLRGGEEQAVS